MKVNPSQETAASLLGTAISRDKLLTDFQASLDVARRNQQHDDKPAAAPDAAAMSSAMDAALKELEDYIAKGPIAHMREKILEELGLSEEDLARMPPDQRDAIEKTIAARIKEWLLSGSGIAPKNVAAQMQLLGMMPAVTAAKAATAVSADTQGARDADTAGAADARQSTA